MSKTNYRPIYKMSPKFSDQNKGLSDVMSAVIDQDIDLLETLIQNGANLEVRDKQGQNALYHAFPDHYSSKVLETLKLLVSSGINVNASLDGDGCSALVTAIVMDWPEVVDLLLKNGADIDEDAMAKTCGSLSSGAIDLIKKDDTTEFIFSKGCGHAVTPLLCAVMYQKHHIVEILLKANAATYSLSYGTFWRASSFSVCSSCDIKVTPLHMAAYRGDLKNTYALLQKKDELPNCEPLHEHNSYFSDITPLWLALLQGHHQIVKLFLSLEKPGVLACHFGSGLQICLEEGHNSLALMLLRAGYNLNDDLEWIEEGQYPCSDEEVIQHIEALVNNPRPLMDWCASSLRERFGLDLDSYLKEVGAPRKVFDIVNFTDLSKITWQKGLKILTV